MAMTYRFNSSIAKKEAFYNELSVLLEAGLDIRASLEMIAAEQKKEKDTI